MYMLIPRVSGFFGGGGVFLVVALGITIISNLSQSTQVIYSR